MLVAILVVVIAVGVATFFWLNTLLAKSQSKESVDSGAINVAKTVPLPKGKEPVPPKPGATNILVLGSDMRPDEPEKFGRSDTLMLVHVDPDANFVSILSMPRDLRIDLGSHGHQKLNAAYAYGGVPLTIQTVRELTGLTIDKYVHIDFDAFRKLTTQLGGVYVDVDRRYYSNNPDYERIDVQPGYQKLAGDAALKYVRFRHDLNSDWGRIDRQQYYLRAAKEQGVTLGNAGKIKQLVELAAGNIGTDLSGLDIFKLAWWGIRLPSGRVKQVNLNGSDEYIGGVAYVLAGDEQVRGAVDELMTPPAKNEPATDAADTATTATTVPRTKSTTTTLPPSTAAAQARTLDLEGVSVEALNANGRKGEAAAAADLLSNHGARIRNVDTADKTIAKSVVLYPADLQTDGAQVALALGIHKMVEDNSRRRIVVVTGGDFKLPKVSPPPGPHPAVVDGDQWAGMAKQVSFPVMGPTSVPGGYKYAGYRVYDIATDQGPKPSLKVMYRFGEEDQFFGFMETTFADAPAAEAGERVKVGDTTFNVVSLAGKVDHVWWKQGDTLYWVSNTLAYLLNRDQMLSIAKSMVPVK